MVCGRTVAIYADRQGIFSFTNVKSITLGTVKAVYKVGGGAGGMSGDRE